MNIETGMYCPKEHEWTTVGISLLSGPYAYCPECDKIYVFRPIELKKKAPATLGEKIHTIRADPKNRWKPGNQIHMVVHNRTPNRFQFAPVLNVKSIQDIEISTGNNGSREECLIRIDNTLFADFSIDGIDTHYDYNRNGAEQLAINDGFSDLSCFVDYFSPGFQGKIIHWTNHQY